MITSGGGSHGGGAGQSPLIRNHFGPSGTMTFRKSRIMTSWGNQMHINEGDEKSVDHHFCLTSLAWLPVEYLPFYLSNAEYEMLPVGTRVQNVNCSVMPLGTKLSFNTGTTNSLWTNSSQVIFGMSAIGLNRTGFAKARQIQARDTSHPMKVTSTEDVSLEKLVSRLYGIPQKTTQQREYLKELPSTMCTFRSLPWYTAIATPAGARPFADTWPDISKHVTQFAFTNADVVGHHYLKANYSQLIEKYGSTNPGGSHSYLVQPSAHIGINAVQANAPDDGLNTVAEFVNACAYWLVECDCTVSFDAERMYNYTSYARNMQLDFRADSISDPAHVYNYYHVLGYFNEAHKG